MKYALLVVAVMPWSMLALLAVTYRRCLRYESLTDLSAMIRPANLERMNLSDFWNAWFNVCLLSRAHTLRLDGEAEDYAFSITNYCWAARRELLKAFFLRRIMYSDSSKETSYETVLGLYALCLEAS